MKTLFSLISIFFISTMILTSSASAQLEIGLVGATTFNQINGDNAMGFNKTGFNIGLESNLTFNSRVGISTGIQYSTKGSKVSEAFQNNSLFNTNTQLEYLVIPFHLRYYSDYGLFFSGGTTFGRLLNTSSTPFNNEIEALHNIQRKFNKYELGAQVQIGYRINENIQTVVGWGQSLKNILIEDIANKNGLQNQQFTLQFTYFPNNL